MKLNNNQHLLEKKEFSYLEKKKLQNKIALYSFIALTVIVMATILAVVIYLLVLGSPGIKYIFTDTWDPSTGKYGMLPCLIGTIFTTFLAVLIGTPIAVFSTLFIFEFCNLKTKKIINSILEWITGIPSVVLGFFAFSVLNNVIPYSFFLGGLVLAFMIIPQIMTFMNIALDQLPEDYRYASYALGATKTETAFKVTLRFAIPAIRAGILSSISRAVGETMAITLIIGGSTALPDFMNFWNGFVMRSGSTFTSIIITNFQEASGTEKSVLIFFGVIILILVTICNLGALWIQKIGNRKYVQK